MNKAFIWILGLSALIISITGATFSIMGLTKLFAGAPIAVGIMAAALELAKMVSASFLHRNWKGLNIIMKTYLSVAVGILMCITSMGIFGYLSWAYQKTSSELKDVNTRIQFLESEDRKVQGEVERVQKTIDQIPENRITKRIETQKELEPHLQQLQKQAIEIQMKMRNEKLKANSYSMEIGPVIFVAELMKANTDNVATYLIILFVIVFDPLAVCLVLATTYAATHHEELLASSSPSRAGHNAA
ncbi:MAG: hypothetical protein AB7F86_10290 [Bdellovibrionales bacterium]